MLGTHDTNQILIVQARMAGFEAHVSFWEPVVLDFDSSAAGRAFFFFFKS